MLCFDGEQMLFVFDQSAKIHQNRSHDYKNSKNTDENAKFIRKVLDESVEAIKSKSFSLKILSRVFLTSSLSQWDLSVLR